MILKIESGLDSPLVQKKDIDKNLTQLYTARLTYIADDYESYNGRANTSVIDYVKLLNCPFHIVLVCYLLNCKIDVNSAIHQCAIM